MFIGMTYYDTVKMRQTTNMFCVSGAGRPIESGVRPFTSSLPTALVLRGIAKRSEKRTDGYSSLRGIETQRDLWGLGHVVVGGDDAGSLERWGQDQRACFPLRLPTGLDHIAMGSVVS